MTSNTENAFRRLDAVNWFAHVGEAVGVPTGFGITRLTNWDEAINLRGADATSDAFMEASNMLTQELSRHHRLEYRRWNDIAAPIRENLNSYILTKVDSLATTIFADEVKARLLMLSVRWDLTHFALEQAYSHLIPPRFYERALRVYEGGHFPCGWDENWPLGKIVLY